MSNVTIIVYHMLLFITIETSIPVVFWLSVVPAAGNGSIFSHNYWAGCCWLEVAGPDCMFKSDIPDGSTVDGLGIDNKLAMIVRVSMVALSWFLHNNKI